MDIAALSMNLSQNKIMTDVGTAMLSKSLDQAESNGNQLIQIMNSAAMEVSVNPSIGSNFDMRV